jgi:hypothetical protein
MTRKTTFIGMAAVALIALTTERASAQGTAAPPTAPAPHVSPSPPPVAQTVLVPASALPPTDSAVALCNNGTFVKEPGTVADCASRGGLRVAMPPRVKAPALAPALAPSFSLRPAIADQAPPAGATMRCKDGTYLSGTASANRCANNGGLAAILPPPPPVPPTPAKRP